MKRIISLILVVLLAAPLFACGNAEERQEAPAQPVPEADAGAGEEAEAAETETDLLATLPEASYDGYSFGILAVPEESCVGIQSFDAAELNGEIINDIVFERNEYVKQRYDVDITLDHMNGAVAASVNLVAAGDETYDLVSDEAKYHVSYSTQGIFRDLGKVASLDMDAPWWYADAAKTLTLEGRLFEGYSDLNTQIKERLACEFVNLDMISALALQDPYQLVLEGGWTIDAMRDMAEAAATDKDNDGKLSLEDVGGYVVGIGSYNVLINGAGCPTAVRTEDGGVDLNVGNEDFIAAAEKIARLVNDAAFTVYLNRDGWGTDMFAEGRALFREGNLYIYNTLRDYDSYFGILPVPKYDEAQKEYRSMMNNSSMGVSIPASIGDPERTGVILEAMNAYSFLKLKDAYYETMLKGKLARDEESVRMLDVITGNIVVDYGVMNEIAWGTVISGWLNSMEKSGAENLASVAASNRKIFDKTYQKMLDAFAKLP